MGSAYSLASGPEKGLIQDSFEWGREKPPPGSPVSGRLWGSEIPGGRTRTRWTERSKASSSLCQEQDERTKIQGQISGVQSGWKLGGGTWKYCGQWGHPYWGPRSRRCPWRLGAARPLRSCGAAVGQSRGHLGLSLQKPAGGQCEGLEQAQHSRLQLTTASRQPWTR